MKLGIDCRNVTDTSSGLVDFVFQLATEVAQANRYHLVLFYNPIYTEVFTKLLDSPNVTGVPAYYAASFLSLKTFLYEQMVFKHLIEKQQLDLFHNPFGFGIPSGLQTPSIQTIHDVIPLRGEDVLSPLANFIYTQAMKISLSTASHIVTISKFTTQELLHFYPYLSGKPITTMYDGIDSLAPYADNTPLYEQKKQEFSIREPYLLYVGSATKRKNLPRLIQAFILLKQQFHIPHQLVVVSKFNRSITLATKRTIMKYLSDASLENDVVYPGYISKEEKAVLLKHADLFIYPSTYEGFGLPILEAMTVGTPAVCSDISVFHEIYGNTVSYFDPNNPAHIAETIRSVLSDTALQHTLITNGTQLAQQFSWSKMANEYMNLYDRLGTTASSSD